MDLIKPSLLEFRDKSQELQCNIVTWG